MSSSLMSGAPSVCRETAVTTSGGKPGSDARERRQPPCAREADTAPPHRLRVSSIPASRAALASASEDRSRSQSCRSPASRAGSGSTPYADASCACRLGNALANVASAGVAETRAKRRGRLAVGDRAHVLAHLPVQPVLLDVGDDRLGGQVANRTPLAHPGSQIGRGDRKRRHVDVLDAKARLQRCSCARRAASRS